jgi:hypothetical protein
MNYNEIFKKVFLWMFVGLLITFATGYVVSVSPNMIEKIFSSSMYIILAIIELALVIILSARITKMNPTTARILFILYSFVTGLTFSSIFIVYEMSSIIYVFLITAIVFGILSFIGYTTNVDLTKMGTYLLIGLIAVLISTIINIFVGNGTFEIIICIISVLVFLGFTAYDVQKIKQLSNYYDENSIAIIGALELYLDFINIFLDLLRLFAKERN